MASLRPHRSHLPLRRHFLPSSNFTHLQTIRLFSLSTRFALSRRIRAPNSRHLRSKANSEIEVEIEEAAEAENETPRFDINLAVILAGFAFEAYSTPPDNVGKLEVDAANCKTLFLSQSFIREIYDGQLFVKLKKGLNLPAMDPWGTSDPYVVLQLDSQVLKSTTKWGSKEPTWNEEFTFNIKLPPITSLQLAAWDANLVTPHKRMGNGIISLETLCEGELHDLMVELEGMGGGGKLQLEVRYKSFGEIDEENKWWKIPFVTELLQRSGFESALKTIVGSDGVQASQFVQYAFGQIKSLNDAYLQNDLLSSLEITEKDKKELPMNETSIEKDRNPLQPITDSGEVAGEKAFSSTSDKQFWNNFADLINQNVVKKLGLPPPENLKWDGFDLLNKIGLQSQRVAEAGYIESGLAIPENQSEAKSDKPDNSSTLSNVQTSVPDIKKVTQELLRQTDSVLGAVMVLNSAVTQLNIEENLFGKKEIKASNENEGDNKKLAKPSAESEIDKKRAEEMKALFTTAESAMEAWAMLATSAGHPSFIKSEFQKICFLDNPSTDTQVAIWRDTLRKRLVVAFRGTEQTRWKDLITDLMLIPAGLNPERIGGDFKQEIQVHSGFLSAYDSVKTRLLSLIKQAVGCIDGDVEPPGRWHVYITGHSLGGALATLLALELSSSQLAKRGVICVTMYNFGSPRVGNRKFADLYNEKLKDSWRVVNHRDIIPTVPRLMGYCHVAQPIYLAAGDLKMARGNVELMEDGYQGDVIGEATPDVLVSEFMKGEKEFVEKILNTEINIFRSIRDGSALMQHMEDFYYISLLESVRSNYQTAGIPQPREEGGLSA